METRPRKETALLQEHTLVCLYHNGEIQGARVTRTDARLTTVEYTDGRGRQRRVIRSTRRLIEGHNAILNLAEAIANSPDIKLLE